MTDFVYEELDGTAVPISLNAGETALDGLLRSGMDISHGCRSGVCQSCLLQTDAPVLPDKSQRGLRDTQKQQGLFLSCCLVPESNITVRKPGMLERHSAVVLDKQMFNEEVLRLRLRAELNYRAGQYVTVWKNNSTARSYSLASVMAEDDFIELHVRIYLDGAFSSWASEELKVGDSLELQGPMGECFYTQGNQGSELQQELLLVGIGTGVAPLYGILKEALANGHQGKINLIAGGRDKRQARYLESELSQLEDKYAQLKVYYCVASDEKNFDIYTLVKEIKSDCRDVKAFVCGAQSFVQKMKKQIFLSGANMADISSDPFIQFV